MHKKAIYHILLGFTLAILDLFEDLVLGGKERLFGNFSSDILPLTLSFFATCIAIYFINFKIICPLLLSKKRIYFFILSALLLVPLFAGIRFLLEEIILFQFTGTHNYLNQSRTFSYYIYDNSYYALKPILLSSIIFLIFQFIENKKKIFELQVEHSKAEVTFLRSQISPHFLFNTLNTFYSSLIITEPKTAKSIQRLSELLRYVTHESNKNNTALKDEIKFIEDYLHFYALRYEDELNVNFQVIGEITTQKIPSLILIHFIENLFKHGVINNKQHPANITIEITNTSLELKTTNSILTSDKHSVSGIGTNNIQTRLKALFGNRYMLNNRTENNEFKTHLKLPLENE